MWNMMLIVADIMVTYGYTSSAATGVECHRPAAVTAFQRQARAHQLQRAGAGAQGELVHGKIWGLADAWWWLIHG